ncbi:MAG: HD domain-containing protein [Anaerolineales bacterium]|nr:HD domain-containing protein [Anaerolineales bacterium]
MITPAPNTLEQSRPAPASFAVPARHNPRLQALVECLNADDELRQWWRCANVTAVERLGLSDHGETHARIVANASLRMLRLLLEAGQTPHLMRQHGLGREEAEVLVVLAAALHDLGLAVHSQRTAELGLSLALPKLQEWLRPLYAPRERVILAAETLHAIGAHHGLGPALTLEAGVLSLADALDMAKGRTRRPAAGETTPAADATIEDVSLRRGGGRPVRIDVRVNQPVGAGYANAVLRRRLANSSMAAQVEIYAHLVSGAEQRLYPSDFQA